VIDASTGLTPAHKQVQLIQDTFERDAKFVDVVAPWRTFIRQGTLKKKYAKTARHAAGTKQYTFYLFSDLLVLAGVSKQNKRLKMKAHYPLYDATIKPTAGAKKENNEAELKIGRKKPTTLVMSTEAERDDWVTAIDIRIQETKKNPPVGSPYGKGGVHDEKTGDDDEPKPAVSITPKMAVSNPAPSGGISEAAARLGIVEELVDDDPEANLIFENETFEPVVTRPKPLTIVI